MSVSDPLLKDLKGCILNLVKSNNEVIGDSHPTLEFLCTTLEAIFRKGLSGAQTSPFGITRKDYWSWIEFFLNSTIMFDTTFKLSLFKLLDSPRTTTVQGRGRLFIRHALSSRCLHIPVEAMKKIEAGDVIDEVFGVCIRGWRKGKIAALLKQHKGLPVSLNVIKGRCKNGQIYPGLLPILRRLQLDMDCDRPQGASESSLSDSEETPSSPRHQISGYHVTLLGSVDVGGLGDVSLIDGAVTAVLASKQTPIDVAMVTGEIGVQTVSRTTRKLLLSHSYTEISSCGRRNGNPLLYAYIAGNTSCNLSSQFTCYVFQASTEQLSKEILLTLADGFHRTHWTV